MKKNILFISLSLGILIILGIGLSYSLWNISVSQDNINVATTKCFNVEITSQKNSISLENAYPISNEKGKKLTPFSFTVTNTCDIFASYTVNLESLKDTTLSSKFINAMINNEEIKRLSDYEPTDTVNTGSIESHTLAKGSLGSGDSEDYTLKVWIDYDTTTEDLDNETKTFKSKIVVKAQPSSWNPVDEGYTTLHDAILANEYQTTPETAIKKIEAKGTPDFSETAPISENDLSDKGLYKSKDDYGDSYYYRGKVNNNNVYFAGFYWQIIRINGNGTIRLLYNGKEKQVEGTAKCIGISSFNIAYDKPAYVGYMYGNPNSNNYNEVHANINDSTIKAFIDTWYKNKISNSKYNDYISLEDGFCGNRTIRSGDGVDVNNISNFGHNNMESFVCENPENDLYSYSSSPIGNNKLSYPIGLITYNELIFAGMNNNKVNKLSYVFGNFDYWTISPWYYIKGYASVSRVRGDGIIFNYYDVSGGLGVRPVISLKPDVKISGGIGTINEPFIIKTE